MDREPEELQFLGFIGIYRSSYNLILSLRRLFTQIALTLILPLSLLFLAHIEITHLLFSEIHATDNALDRTPDNVPSPSRDRLLSRLASEWSAFFLFKALYLLFLLVFSLLSTSAVVYTVASAFSAKDLSFPKVLSVVPKVWKRLAVTFLSAFALLFVYNAAAIAILISILLLLGGGAASIFFSVVLLLVYLVGLAWISVVWHVASVVSVLEDSWGLAAMRKSRDLVKGKLGIAAGIFVKLNLVFLGIEIGFRKLVVEGWNYGVLPRLGYGVLMLSMLSLVILFGLVVQTVVYFVCKSYHHESIDKSALADHLEVYLGDYVPLKAKDVQLEHFYA